VKNLLLSFFAAIVTFFTGNDNLPPEVSQPSVEVSPTPSAVASPSVKPSRKPTPTAKPTAKPSSTPSVISHPSSTPAAAPTIVPKNTFTPITKSGTFRPGMGNCSANPTGSYTFEIVNYIEKDNITDVKIKVSAQGLVPGTRYVLNVGSTSQLGGPHIYADSTGSLEYNFDNGGYTVNYKQIYSLSIDDPNKLYPDNACLHDDLSGGLG
jgi:hypothetical protein